MTTLQTKKLEKYFRLCLTTLPSKAQSEDLNKLALVFFAISGLDVLGRLELSATEREEYAKFVYSHLVSHPLGIQGFRATQTFKLDPGENYDVPNLASTFFALLLLLQFQSNYDLKVDRTKIMGFLQKLQVTDANDPEYGSFKPVVDDTGAAFGESDLRHCYTALCVRKLLKYDELPLTKRQNDIDIKAVQKYLKSRISFNGGMSSLQGTEPHAGLTFCGVAALKLSGFMFDQDWVQDTLGWLVHRQVDYPSTIEPYRYMHEAVLREAEDYEYWEPQDVGGFNGRENKFSDTCYSWWTGASLKLLIGDEGVALVDIDRAEKFLLEETQNTMLGGFSKNAESFPDPLHSYLGLAALSLMKFAGGGTYEGAEEIKEVDELLAAPKSLVDFLAKIYV